MKDRRKQLRFKKVYWLYFVIIDLVMLSSVYVHAAEKMANAESSWYEHVDLMNLIIIGLLGIVGFFTVRLLNRIDNNQKLLFDRQNEFNTRLSNLEGAHNQAMIDGAHGRR